MFVARGSCLGVNELMFLLGMGQNYINTSNIRGILKLQPRNMVIYPGLWSQWTHTHTLRGLDGESWGPIFRVALGTAHPRVMLAWMWRVHVSQHEEMMLSYAGRTLQSTNIQITQETADWLVLTIQFGKVRWCKRVQPPCLDTNLNHDAGWIWGHRQVVWPLVVSVLNHRSLVDLPLQQSSIPRKFEFRMHWTLTHMLMDQKFVYHPMDWWTSYKSTITPCMEKKIQYPFIIGIWGF